jgi:hypothetical protein
MDLRVLTAILGTGSADLERLMPVDGRSGWRASRGGKASVQRSDVSARHSEQAAIANY